MRRERQKHARGVFAQRAVHVYRELGFETVSSDGADTKMRLDLTTPVPPAARPTTGTESRG